MMNSPKQSVGGEKRPIFKHLAANFGYRVVPPDA